MFLLQLVLISIALYILLFYFLPKGNPIQEMLYLPFWWFKMYQLPSQNMSKTKYKYGKHFRQYIMHYAPKNGKTTKQNVIVYIHGGGWQFARPQGFEPNAQEWVNEGYFVFMPSHRRIPFYDIRDMREDLNLIFKKIRMVLNEKDLGNLKIILGGMSSGANLSALLALDTENQVSESINPNLISGLFLLGAPLNLRKMRPSPIIFSLAGFAKNPKFKKADPIQHLTKKPPFKILGIHGDKDGLVEIESVIPFYEKLERLDSNIIEFHNLKEITHLETAGWSFLKNGVRKIIFDWLQTLEK